VLAGCAAAGQSSGGAPVLSEAYDGALPIQTQLIVGSLRLEESEAAVTGQQAADLIPLWKAVRSLSGSDTAAEAELEALLEQILQTMTDEQLAAIAAMQLTQEDLLSMLQELGPGPQGADGEQVFQFGGRGAGEGPPAGFVLEGAPPEGFQGGGPGGGGQVFDQGLDPDQIATAQASRGQQGVVRGELLLIESLLELLEVRAGTGG
jgi:hypothetical protein